MKDAATAYPTLQEIQANPLTDKHGQRGRVVLALDLSQSCVGWAVGQYGHLARYGKLVFKTTAMAGSKLTAFSDFVRHLLLIFRPNEVVIEKPLSQRADVTARHYELVGVLRHLVYQHLKIELTDEHLIPPQTVKKWMAVERGANHKENKKIMVEKINHLFSLSLHYDPNSKTKTDDDVADAIAVLETRYRKGGRS